jgi:hypothetical protein
MQNGAAVEANLSSTLGQWAADGRADDRDHFGKPLPGGTGRTGASSANCRKRSSRLPRSISCRGNVLQFHLTSAAMFMAQPADTPQMLRDVGLARSVNGAHDV